MRFQRTILFCLPAIVICFCAFGCKGSDHHGSEPSYNFPDCNISTDGLKDIHYTFSFDECDLDCTGEDYCLDPGASKVEIKTFQATSTVWNKGTRLLVSGGFDFPGTEEAAIDSVEVDINLSVDGGTETETFCTNYKSAGGSSDLQSIGGSSNFSLLQEFLSVSEELRNKKTFPIEFWLSSDNPGNKDSSNIMTCYVHL